MRMKRFLLLLVVWALCALRAEEVQRPTIFMIGDSTMANKVLEGGNPERGWGQMLPGWLGEGIEVDNRAVNGRSSKSFIDEGRWDEVCELLKPGDYLFIQFGHNDEKADTARHTVAGGSFDDNLRRFVNEARERGAKPVLFNSIVRRNFGVRTGELIVNVIAQDDIQRGVNPDARTEAGGMKAAEGEVLMDTHGAYLESPRRVAKELGVPFVDMNRLTHELVQGMGAEESKRLFMWIPANEVAYLPKGREDNTHLNVYGARLIAGLALDEIVKVVPELGAYVRRYDMVVAKDGSGDFLTLQEAIDAVPDYRKNVRTTILLRRGVYKEKIVIAESKINLSIIGEEGAIITNDDYASKLNGMGQPMGTSGSATCYIYAPDFYAENITFENSAGPVGQAVACLVGGDYSSDRIFFKNCRFLGFQDTLYTYGKGVRQYYEDCYIEGTVDFIFGWSAAVFNRCCIHSKANGYVTAPATDEGQTYGYLFYECRLTADPGVKAYLSRPWRPYAKAVFAFCELGEHIRPEGWDNWGSKDKEKTVFYAEYQNRGKGAEDKGRVGYAVQLKNLDNYTMEQVLAGNDGWNPIKNGNALLEIKR